MNRQYFEMAQRIKFIHNAFAGNRSRSLEQHDLTFSQMEIMLYLKHHSGKIIYQKEIETASRLTNPTVTGILSRLEEKGMILRQVDEKDRRFRRVELTDKGKDVLKGMGAGFHDTEEKLFGCLDEAEKEQFLHLLKKITDREHVGYEREHPFWKAPPCGSRNRQPFDTAEKKE